MIIGDIENKKKAHGVSKGDRTIMTKKVSDIPPEEGGGQTAKAFLPSCVPELKLEEEMSKRNWCFV